MHDKKNDKAKDYLLGLHWAATTGNVGLVKFALDHGAPIDSVVNGFMPLQLACISDNNIAVVQYLIDRGAQVNAQRWPKKHSADKSQAVAGAIGSTALHVACANGCTKIVELLLRNDAKVDVKDKYGSRPLDIAAAKHHVEIVKLLETFGALQKSREADLQQYEDGRRSMDVIYSSKKNQMNAIDDRAERMRRPSLPSVFEGKSSSKRKITSPALDIPPLSTLPPTPLQRKNLATSSRLSLDQDSSGYINGSGSIDIQNRRPSRYNNYKIPDLAYSKSSDDSVIGTPPLPSSLQNTSNSNNSKYINNNNNGESSSTTTSSYSITSTKSNRYDGYSYGVLNYDGEENYLTSLERRAYGLDDYPTRQSLDQVRPVRLSLDTYADSTSSSVHNNQLSPSSPLSPNRPRLKRCSSDGGFLRATALRNAMSVKKSNTPINNNENNNDMEQVPSLPDISTLNINGNNNNNISTSTLPTGKFSSSSLSNDYIQHHQINEPLPRRSIATDDRSLEALRQIEEKEMKKAWWSAFGGRKSMDAATFHRHNQQHHHINHHHQFDQQPNHRSSLDFRPSFDGLSSHWNNKNENPSGDAVDMNFEEDEYDLDPSSQQRKGFFSRWVGNWSKK